MRDPPGLVSVARLHVSARTQRRGDLFDRPDRAQRGRHRHRSRIDLPPASQRRSGNDGRAACSRYAVSTCTTAVPTTPRDAVRQWLHSRIAPDLARRDRHADTCWTVDGHEDRDDLAIMVADPYGVRRLRSSAGFAPRPDSKKSARQSHFVADDLGQQLGTDQNVSTAHPMDSCRRTPARQESPQPPSAQIAAPFEPEVSAEPASARKPGKRNGREPTPRPCAYHDGPGGRYKWVAAHPQSANGTRPRSPS